MKIMATFDGSPFSESILPHLAWMAVLPEAQFLLFSVADEPEGRRQAKSAVPTPPVVAVMAGAQPVVIESIPAQYAETKGQAIARRLDELERYLRGVAQRLPVGPRYNIGTCVSHDAAAAIIQRGLKERPDVIVMATHGRTGLVHMLFGDVAEEVVRSSVAPVLLVHPDGVRHARGGGGRAKCVVA